MVTALNGDCTDNIMYLQAFCGILNLSIISSLWGLSGEEALDSDVIGRLEIPNKARIPLLHSARERVTKVAVLEMLVLCPLVIWGKNRLQVVLSCLLKRVKTQGPEKDLTSTETFVTITQTPAHEDTLSGKRCAAVRVTHFIKFFVGH